MLLGFFSHWLLTISSLCFFPTYCEDIDPLGDARDGRAACGIIERELGQAAVEYAGSRYNQGVSRLWSSFNEEAKPSCIVFPTSTRQVQVAMKAIYSTGSRYAVQAGGHSPMVGWNNVEHGVLILLSEMRDISYNSQKNTVSIQPGLNWSDTLTALEPYGVAVMGGRVNDVGTGLLLGGGLSFLAASHGFSSDAFVELDVVLVTGKAITATATNKYSDLFRALKGGGNRFGIVTRYELEAIRTGTKEDKLWFGGTIMWDISEAEPILRAIARYVKKTKDPNAALILYFAYIFANGTLTGLIIANPFYRGPSLPESIFGDFLSIPSISTSLSAVSYYEAANTLIDPQTPQQTRGHKFGASAFSGGLENEHMYLDAFQHFSNFSEGYKGEFDTIVLAFTPVLDTQILAGRGKGGGNPMAPPLGGYNAVQFEVTFPEGVRTVSKGLEDGRQLFLERIPPSPGLPLYINECDAKQNVFSTYGQYEFMKRTYQKYDPKRFNMRHTLGPIGL